MTRTSNFITHHPICSFCGGQTASSTIDHQPALIVFPNKQRPKGLEFPACSTCNRQTSADEALLAFVCRVSGSLRTNAPRDFDRFKDIIGSINRSFPGLLQRMDGGRSWAKERGLWARAGAFNVNHPEVHLALCRIAAKLALAIYYENHLQPASAGCLINTQWTHCQNADAVKYVENLIGAIPTGATTGWRMEDRRYLLFEVPLQRWQPILSRYFP
jgi:hypothetical protein